MLCCTRTRPHACLSTFARNRAHTHTGQQRRTIREPFGGLRFGLGGAVGVVNLTMVEQLRIRQTFGGFRFGWGGTIGVVFVIDGVAIEHPRTIRTLAFWLGRDDWSYVFYRWWSN